jgi:hypothetical protein
VRLGLVEYESKLYLSRYDELQLRYLIDSPR